MSNPTPQDRYPIDRFLTDLAWALAEAARLPVPHRHSVVSDHLAATYPHDPFAAENRRRLLACADWLLRHWQELVVEHFLSQNGDEYSISPHLQGGLYRRFVAVQLEFLDRDFPLSDVLDLAEEQQRLYPDRDDE